MQREPFEERLRAYLDDRAGAAGSNTAVDRTLRAVFEHGPHRHARRLFMTVVIAVVAALVVATPVTVFLINRAAPQTPTPVAHATPVPSQRASVSLSGTPGVMALNPTTGTLYVPIECPTFDCTTESSMVDVINSAKCNAVVVSDCHVVAQAEIGGSPKAVAIGQPIEKAVAIDQATDTIYVTGSNGTTAVFDGAHCNATVTSGCGAPRATIDVGGAAAVFDSATRTLYVADPEGGIHVINAATCNAVATTGCGQADRLIVDNNSPESIDIDVATDTVYAVNTESGGGFVDAFGATVYPGTGDATGEAAGKSTVSVIDGATCNGTDGSGCSRVQPAIPVGSGAFWVAVDQATGAVYVTNDNDGTVSIIDGARCNAATTSGCARTPVAVQTGAWPAGVAVDENLHTVFSLNANDDTLSAINTRTCNGVTVSGCPQVARAAQAGPDSGPGFSAYPQSITLDTPTNTAYVASIGTENVLDVLSISGCDASQASSCRVASPSVPDPEYSASTDAATDTIYASNSTKPEIDVINGATCNATQRSGCASVAEIPMADPDANVGAIDDTTHTLYASDPYGRTVSVLNTATCNAADTRGCADQPGTVSVGVEPGAPVLDAATHTLYVPVGTTANEIAVVDVATCNAEVNTGCGLLPASIDVGNGTKALAISVKNDTIYAPSLGSPEGSAETVAVINGATCNGTVHSGCGSIAATATVGPGPYGVAVDDANNTVYVANNQNGFDAGTVSIINEAACNGTHIAGCAGPFRSIAVGRSPRLVVVDPTTDTVYITDHGSADVSQLDGATCNATVTAGCSTAVTRVAIGSQPYELAVNTVTHNVYVMTQLGGAAMSILAGQS
jgi:DNA-binding beta-propeller fold protein YncE